MKRFLALALGTLTLAACETEETIYLGVPAETTAWLADTDGQTLTFATAGGSTQTVQVARWADKDNYTGKGVTVLRSTEWQFARYRRAAAADTGFSVAGHEYHLEFFRTESPGVDQTQTLAYEAGSILTNNNGSYTSYSGGRSIRLDYNQPLGGQTYPALVTVDFVRVDTLAAPATSNRLRRIYYARDHGLVGFRTANGQLWLRQ